jgi:hypothetical protein
MSITMKQAQDKVDREGGLPKDGNWQSYHVMVYLLVCYTKLKTLMKEHDLPYHKMGTTKGRNYFRRSEIDEWRSDHFFLPL